MSTAVLVDGRNIFNPDSAAAAGFDYTGIGRIGRSRKVDHQAVAATPPITK
jgi:hypothetical protein